MDETTQERRQQSVLELDVTKIGSEDFDKYVIDFENDPVATYGDEVLKRESFYEDVNFAILDLAWRVRREDLVGGDIFKKVEEMVKKKGKRFGFIFAYTFLNSCHAIDDDNVAALLPEDKYRISEPLQEFMVQNIDIYFDSIGVLVGVNEEQIYADIKALGRTINRSFLDIGYWKDRIDEKRRTKKPVGDGYLNIDESIKLFKVMKKFGEREDLNSDATISAEVYSYLRYEENLKDLGIES